MVILRYNNGLKMLKNAVIFISAMQMAF